MILTTKNLKKIINKVVNESMYVKRRAGEIEDCFESALDSVDPMGYDDEFEYISDVIEETTKDFLDLSDNIQRFSDEWYELFDEVSYFIRSHLYYKIQDHYDTVRSEEN